MLLLMGISLALQLTAAGIAFRLTRLSGPKYGWVLLGAALVLMSIRRGITFFRIAFGDTAYPPDMVAECVALAISVFSVVGIAGVAPLFRFLESSSDTLRLKEGRLRVALESGNMTTWEWNVQLDRVVWDERVCEVLGVKPDALPVSSTEYYNLVVPQDLPGLKRAAERAAEDRRHLDVEFRIVRPDNGETRWIAAKGKFLFDADDQPDRMIGVNYDITRTKEAQEKIRVGDERFRLLIDSIHDYSIHMLDLSGRVSTWNEGAQRIWGYTAEEIIGSDFSVFYTQEDLAARLPDRSLRIAESKGQYALEGWRVRKDRSTFWADVSITPIRDAKGTITGYARVTRDLTERKAAEDAVQEAKSRLQIAQDIAKVGTWTWELRDNYVEVSDNWLEILGFAPECRRMVLDQWVEKIAPDDQVLFMDAIRRGVASSRPFQARFRITRGDNTACHVNAWGKPHADLSGQVFRISGAFQDITEHLLSQKALDEGRQRLAGIIESAMDGIISIDHDHRIVLFNSAAEGMFNCPASDALGTSIERFIPNRFRFDHRGHIESFATTGTTSRRMGALGAISGLRSGGEEFPLEASISQVEVNGRKVFTVILRDISVRKRTEDALKERERAMTTLLANLPGMAYRCKNDPDWTFEFVSDGSRLVSGYGPDAFLGGTTTWAELIHPDDRDQVWKDVQTAVQNRTTFELTYRIRCAEGIERVVWERGVGVYSSEGEVVALEGFISDITKRTLAERALTEAKAKYESLVQSIEGIVWEADPSTFQFTFVSDWANELTGYAPSEWTASPTFWADHLHPDDREDTVQACLESTRAGQSHTLEYRMLAADGEPVWLRDIVSILPANGRRSEMRGVMIDVTERKQIELALKESEARYRSLIEASTSVVWTTNAEGAFVTPQKSWERYTGQPWAEHQSWSWINAIHPDDRESVRMKWQQSLTDRSNYESEGRIWRKSDESYRWFVAKGIPILNEDGTIREWVGTVTDIEEQRRAAELLRRTNEELELRVRARTAELEQANHEMEAFSYSVSHDLRAPLRSIDGFSLALLEDYDQKLPPPAQTMLNRVRDAAQRMAQLIDDLLALSRFSRSQMRLRQVNLSHIAESILQGLQSLEPARSVEVHIQPEMMVTADEPLIRVALENLLSNAWKFTCKKSDARIEVGMTPGEGVNTYFVKDNGAGFDMAFVDKLFGAFQRLHSAAEFPGNGIGLANVARILHRHKGKVWAEGSPGKGAVFYFTLGTGIPEE